MATVNVTCSLPSGLHLDFPGRPRVTLAGSNSTLPRPNPHGHAFGQPTQPAPGVTEVDADFITAWLAANADLQMVRSGAIAIAS
jgi:hypothetical protein